MMTETEIRALPLHQKLRVMELIWGTLKDCPEEVVGPHWHEEELQETEARRNSGLEQPVDWDVAKRKLLKR